MEKHILRLTEEQRKLNCEVTLAFNQGDVTLPTDIHVLGRINLRKIKPCSLRDLLFYCGLIIKLVGEKRSYDVVHVHGDWSAFLLGRLVAYFVHPKKQIASMHGTARRGIWGGLYRFSFTGYNMVYATGSLDAAYIDTLTTKPVYWQHSGIDSDFLSAKNQPKRTFDVISVGSFVPVKNFELVIQIAEKMPEYTFLMVGDGPQRAAIEADCLRRGITNVTFAGQLESADVARALCRSRVFLLTSFTEGTPTALLEAMACGLAIVTSRSNNYDSLLKSGQNGYVVDGFQPNDYVLKIRELLDSGLLDEISGHNRAQAKNYSWPAVAKQITEWMKVDAHTNQN
ncbi:glycosyltransferase family 4 protein [Desulfuromonas sp. KJ2020]|uniref:glycosyltransferase family 4 protein n=1 Tax=Desulfuromonas sp. KJ2020 TaxID=2919173 RepID=UPI0020A7F425|nr:glycosyltransferase family 4 protein [Desulfuromonas sp. KJ2020]MCP3177490.1 glycosyltransferase family 4 protein [Desulfuromonas sp. KJ2020]